MFRDAQSTAQAHRNAVIPMAHMVKNLQGAIRLIPQSAVELRFTEYTNILTGQTATRRYIFDTVNNRIQYDTNITAGGEQIIGTRIRFDAPNPTTFVISPTHAGVLVDITITAEDNRGQNQNRYTIRSNVEARYGATPPV